MIEVGTYKTSKIFYDPQEKQFTLQDVAGNILATAASQDELEKKAEKVTKQKLNLPMPVLYSRYHSLVSGRITSVDLSNRTCYFVPDNKILGYSKEKLYLNFNHIYPCTCHNLDIQKQIQAIADQENNLQKMREEAMARLESILDPNSFIIHDPC